MATKKDLIVVLAIDDKGTAKIKKVLRDVERETARTQKTQNKYNQTVADGTVTTEQARAGMRKFTNVMKGNFTAIAAGMGTAMLFSSIISGIKNAISKLVETGREFEREWANVTTMMSLGVAETAKYRQQLLNLPPILGKTADLARGMYQVLSASVEPAEAINFLTAAAKAAVGGVTNTKTAVDALTTVINAYGMSASDVTKVSDIMFKTVKRGKLTYEGMAGAIGTVVPIAAQVGVSFEEIAAAMASLTRVGVDVNTTTVQLRQVMVSVLKPTKQARDEAERLGLEFTATALRTKGLVGFLADVQQKTKGNSTSLTQLFGNVRALTGVMGLAGKSAIGFAHDLELMKNASGASQEAFKKQIVTSDAQIKMFNETINKLAINFYAGFVENFKMSSEAMDEWNEKVAIHNKQAEKTGSVLGLIITKGFQYHPLLQSIGALTKEQAVAEVELEKAMIKKNEQLSIFVTRFGPMANAFGTATNIYDKLVSQIVESNLPIEKQLDLLKKVRDEYFKLEKQLNILTDEQEKYEEKVKKIVETLNDTIGQSDKYKMEMDALTRVLKSVELQGGNTDRSIKALGKAIESAYQKAVVAQKVFGTDVPQALRDLHARMVELTFVTNLYLKRMDVSNVMHRYALGMYTKVAGGIGGLAYKTIEAIRYLKELGEGALEAGGKVRQQLLTSLDKAEKALKKFKDAYPVSQQIIVVQNIISLYKQLGIVVPDTYKKMLKELKKLAKEQEKTALGGKDVWVKAFGDLAVAFGVYADRLTGIWRQLFQDLSVFFDQWADEIEENGGDVFAALAEMSNRLLGQIGATIGELISGTKSMFSGLFSAIGSSIGRIFGGDIGAKLGSLLGGLIGGLFGKKDTEPEKTAEELYRERMEAAVNAIIAKYEEWGNISEQTAKKIFEDLETGMKEFVSISKHFADIIGDVGVNQYNINELWERAGDIIHHYKEGLLTTREATESLNESFRLLVEGAKELGQEGSKAMIDFIRKVREYGLDLAEVTKYVLEQLDRIPEALDTLIRNAVPDRFIHITKGQFYKLVDWVGIFKDKFEEKLTLDPEKVLNTDAWKKHIERLQNILGEELFGQFQKWMRQTGKSWNDLLLWMRENEDALSAVVDRYKKRLDRLSELTVYTFHKMIAEGRSYLETLKAMREPFQSLIDQYEQLGLTIPKALIPMAKLLELMEVKPKIFENLDASIAILESLGKAGYMNQQIFNTLTTSVTQFAKAFLDVTGSLKDFMATAKLLPHQIQTLLPLVSQFVGMAAIFGLGVPAWMKQFVTTQLDMNWGDFKEKAKTMANSGLATVDKLTDLNKKNLQLVNRATKRNELLRGIDRGIGDLASAIRDSMRGDTYGKIIKAQTGFGPEWVRGPRNFHIEPGSEELVSIIPKRRAGATADQQQPIVVNTKIKPVVIPGPNGSWLIDFIQEATDNEQLTINPTAIRSQR